MYWLQFGIVSPFALQQPPPRPSTDDSASAKSSSGFMGAKSGNDMMGAKSGNDLMVAKSGNDSMSVSCESLRAWASQPCLEARLCGHDPRSSGGGQDQPTMVCQKASIEIAMKRQVYPHICTMYVAVIYAARCKRQVRNCPSEGSFGFSCNHRPSC